MKNWAKEKCDSNVKKIAVSNWDSVNAYEKIKEFMEFWMNKLVFYGILLWNN